MFLFFWFRVVFLFEGKSLAASNRSSANIHMKSDQFPVSGENIAPYYDAATTVFPRKDAMFR